MLFYFPFGDVLGDESPVLQDTSWPFAVSALPLLGTSGWFQGYSQHLGFETLPPRSDEARESLGDWCHISAWMFRSCSGKEICFQPNSHMTKALCHEAFPGAEASLAVGAVALLAGLVWLRAAAAPARCRGMAARFSPVLLAEWLG